MFWVKFCQKCDSQNYPVSRNKVGKVWSIWSHILQLICRVWSGSQIQWFFLMLPKAAQIILQTNIASKKHLAVKHLNPCFLATSVQSNYLELLWGIYRAYISKYNLQPLFSQTMVHFTKTAKLGSMISCTSSTEVKSSFPLCYMLCIESDCLVNIWNFGNTSGTEQDFQVWLLPVLVVSLFALNHKTFFCADQYSVAYFTFFL